jgi:hypothetical protein
MVNVTNRQLHILVCPLAQVYQNNTNNEDHSHLLSLSIQRLPEGGIIFCARLITLQLTQ